MGGVLEVCGECYKLGKLIGLLFLFCLPLLSILFWKTKRNDLAHPVMGTVGRSPTEDKDREEREEQKKERTEGGEQKKPLD